MTSPTPFAPVFVVGCERSGTTLLAALLDRHSQLSIPPETLFFSDVVHHAWWRRGAGDRAGLLRAALAGRVGEFGLDRPRLAAAFGGRDPSPAGLLQAVLEEHARRNHKPRAGEKSILHVLYAHELLDWYPGAKVLGILRDGRDVVASMMRPPWHPNKLHAKCCNWRLKTRRLLDLKERHPERVLLLRYEELLADSAGVLAAADAFLGLDFEPGQLDPSIRPGVYLERERSYKAKVDESVDASRAFAWRREAGPETLGAMHAVLAPTLRRAGYTADAPPPGPWPRRRLNQALAALWIPAFALMVRLRGLILYDKVRYRWRRRRAQSPRSLWKGVQP